ncbi:MAG: VTT domain-containing protein [Bacteroidales bacterium]|nr:VTT domain-containing protein [Bacteroidales bacterium]
MPMKRVRIDIKRLIVVILLVATAITVASLTVGRDIFYGTKDQGLLSFAIVSLTGYLFFLFMPVELAFIYYLNAGENLFLLNLIALGTALISQSIDYIIGYSLSTKIINNLIGRKRFEKAEDKIRQYGNVAIFIFNFFPLSSPVISLAAGMLKHRIKDALFFTLLGLGLKYLAITFIWPVTP